MKNKNKLFRNPTLNYDEAVDCSNFELIFIEAMLESKLIFFRHDFRLFDIFEQHVFCVCIIIGLAFFHKSLQTLFDSIYLLKFEFKLFQELTFPYYCILNVLNSKHQISSNRQQLCVIFYVYLLKHENFIPHLTYIQSTNVLIQFDQYFMSPYC